MPREGAGMLHCFVKVCVAVFSPLSHQLSREVYRLDRISIRDLTGSRTDPITLLEDECMYCYPAILCHLKLHS